MIQSDPRGTGYVKNQVMTPLTVAIKGTSRNLAEVTSGLLIKDSKEQLNIYKVD